MTRYLKPLAYIEAFSMLALLLIAMPIKYIGGDPEPVRWVGMAHGLLFLIFVFAATGVANQERWPGKRLVLAYVASVLPLGPFLFHRQIFPPKLSVHP